jgi:hypothetical protein
MSRKRERVAARRIACAIGALCLFVAAEVAALDAEVTKVSGRVERGRGEPTRWEPLRVGDGLNAGDAVRTGSDGRAELLWMGSTLRLYGDSLLRLPTAAARDGADALEMEAGTSLFDVKRRPGRSLEVRTPEIVVSVKGTRFAVDLSGDGPGVAVYRGAVGVRSLALRVLDEVMVREGFRADGSGGGLPELFLLREGDPWDSWGPDASAPRISAADETHPDRSGLAEAKRAMVRTYRGEVLRRATQADPALARRLAAIGDAKLALRREGPASLDEDTQTGLGELTETTDPILDTGIEEVRNTLEQEFVEAWVNGETSTGTATGGGTGTNTTSFEISLIDGSGGSGSDRVRIDEQEAAQFWELTESDLSKVIDGSQSFPNSLETLLSAAGVTDLKLFAEMLIVMLDSI